jgi:hypothetical protein
VITTVAAIRYPRASSSTEPAITPTVPAIVTASGVTPTRVSARPMGSKAARTPLLNEPKIFAIAP